MAKSSRRGAAITLCCSKALVELGVPCDAWRHVSNLPQALPTRPELPDLLPPSAHQTVKECQAQRLKETSAQLLEHLPAGARMRVSSESALDGPTAHSNLGFRSPGLQSCALLGKKHKLPALWLPRIIFAVVGKNMRSFLFPPESRTKRRFIGQLPGFE